MCPRTVGAGCLSELSCDNCAVFSGRRCCRTAQGCTAEGLTQHRAAMRAAEVGNQGGSGRGPDPYISAKGVQHRREGRGIGVFEVERLQDEPAWRGAGGVLGAAPADQKWHQASRDRAEGQPPPQHRPGRRGPLHAGYLTRVIAAAAGPGHRRVNIRAGNRPADQPTAADSIDAERARHRRLWLTGIGSDDLQVGAGAEREQRIMGAQTDVPATSLGPYPKTFLHIGNRTGQIRGPVDEMVDQHNPIIPRARSGIERASGWDLEGPGMNFHNGKWRLLLPG